MCVLVCVCTRSVLCYIDGVDNHSPEFQFLRNDIRYPSLFLIYHSDTYQRV